MPREKMNRTVCLCCGAIRIKPLTEEEVTEMRIRAMKKEMEEEFLIWAIKKEIARSVQKRRKGS